MTLANMAAELGGQVGLIAPDATTAAFLESVGGTVPDLSGLRTDPGANVAEHHVFDAAALAPQVAAPHSPANAMDVDAAGETPVTVAYIGACTGAKYTDLAAAASLLKGKRLAPGVDLLVAPSSRRDQDRAAADGIMAVFEDAGAKILPNACGICAGYGAHRLGAGVTCISSTARNFRGRMGDKESMVWLGSPLTVAASAVQGRIADPREMI
jgi:3-isopropylmalate/(R)-2-methylmalate dehydratase large subunit